MSKSCAKCSKTVYPMEELKCLDKTWHKGCFKCHDCGMTLNMKTYKGFDKLPYCEAHVPKAKATTVADTPEFKRIHENTKIQSNAVYHAEFEKTKGKFTAVSDDPELMRIKANTKIISNVAYHGDLEKKALMEQQRNLGGDGDTRNKNGSAPAKSPSYMDELSSFPTSSHPSATSHHNYNSSSSHQNAPPQHHVSSAASYNRGNSHEDSGQSYSSSNSSRQYQQQQQQQQSHPPPSNNASHNRDRDSYQQKQPSHHQQGPGHYVPPPQPQQQQQQQYNPSPYSSRGQANVIYTSEGGAVNANASRKVGSISDYDPMNNYYGSIEQQRAAQAQAQAQSRMGPGPGYGGGGGGNSYPQQQHHQSPSHLQQMPQKHHQPQQQPHQPQNSGIRYRALYDYEAQDVDELAFLEGDLIVDCTPIDEGWLTGTNLRSKQRGMLPANYVQPA